MVVNQVTKVAKLDIDVIVKYQIITHCYLQGIVVSESDLDCLTMLAFNPGIELTEFCNQVSDEGIFKSSQSVRNAVNKAERKNLVVKDGSSRKVISLNPDMKVEIKAPVMLNFKFVGLESKEE